MKTLGPQMDLGWLGPVPLLENEYSNLLLAAGGRGKKRGGAGREDSKSCREGTGAGSWPPRKVGKPGYARPEGGKAGVGSSLKGKWGRGLHPPTASGTRGRRRGPHPAGRGGWGRGPGGAGPGAHFLGEGLGPLSHSPTQSGSQSRCNRQPRRQLA